MIRLSYMYVKLVINDVNSQAVISDVHDVD